jgi:hypothetical protein
MVNEATGTALKQGLEADKSFAPEGLRLRSRGVLQGEGLYASGVSGVPEEGAHPRRGLSVRGLSARFVGPCSQWLTYFRPDPRT